LETWREIGKGRQEEWQIKAKDWEEENEPCEVSWNCGPLKGPQLQNRGP